LTGLRPVLDNMVMGNKSPPPILAGKDHAAVSVFEPANLLREARRQKGLVPAAIPGDLPPRSDGDILRALRGAGRATLSPAWACYHTDLYEFDEDGMRFGIIGCAVGAPFAVLIAEELFVSGCRFLISMTSAGQIVPQGERPYFVVIDRALRDEGTSYHYLPPGEFAEADGVLVARRCARSRGRAPGLPRRGLDHRCAVPRDRRAIEKARARNILDGRDGSGRALCLCPRARQAGPSALAHVTNRMAVDAGDFEKVTPTGGRLAHGDRRRGARLAAALGRER